MKAAILLVLFAFTFAVDVNASYLNGIFQETDDDQNSIEQEGELDLSEIFQETDEHNSIEQAGEQDSIEQAVEQNSIEQEDDSPDAIPAECRDDEVQRCLSYILALEDANDETACPAITSTYECLRDKSKACLDSADQEEFKEGLDRIKDALVTHCDYVEEDEKEELQKCIENNTDELVECIFQGLMETLTHYVNTEQNDTEKLKCEAYEAIANCQVEKIREKCSDASADAFHGYMADMPDNIKNSCVSSSDPIELFDVQLLQSRK